MKSLALKVHGIQNHLQNPQEQIGQLALEMIFQGEEGFSIAHQLMRRAVTVPGASVHWYEKPVISHVGIIMGSDSDLPVMKDAAEALDSF